jgi:hypothetical protein
MLVLPALHSSPIPLPFIILSTFDQRNIQAIPSPAFRTVPFNPPFFCVQDGEFLIPNLLSFSFILCIAKRILWILLKFFSQSSFLIDKIELIFYNILDSIFSCRWLTGNDFSFSFLLFLYSFRFVFETNAHPYSRKNAFRAPKHRPRPPKNSLHLPNRFLLFVLSSFPHHSFRFVFFQKRIRFNF